MVSTRVSFEEFHKTIATLISPVGLKIILQHFISSGMVKTPFWPRAAYLEFALFVWYSDGFLHQKHRELGVMSLFSKDEVKPQTETG